MDLIFQINTELDVPIYQQLVDEIRAGVKRGSLVPGQQLPTVQETAQQLGVAKGTIKRAYDELEHQGLLEKIQGRGTFICYQPANSGSRKEQAMAAIDELLDKLEEMGFSQTEINIFLALKQRERTEDLSVLKVAVVECNPEMVSQLSEQMRGIKNIELHSYLFESVRQYPYTMDEETDLVVTTAVHADYLESVLSDRKKIARIAYRLTLETIGSIAKLKPGDNLGILCGSARFCDLIYQASRKYVRNVTFHKPQVFSAVPDLEGFLADKDAVLVPKAYEKYCCTEAAEKLRSFEKRGRLIPCDFEMDEGSFLYLEEKLRSLREEKTK